MKSTAFLFLSSLFFLFGCQSGQNSSDQSHDFAADTTARQILAESDWILHTLEGQKIANDKNFTDEKIHFTLSTEAGSIAGYTGCNRFHGSFTFEKGQRIRFSKMASTKMACPDNEISESEFLQVFELADNYSLHGDTLMLNVGRRAPLAVFVKGSPYVNPITEKYWKLTVLNGDTVTMAKNQERERFFTLKTDENRVTGFAGCNDFHGSYEPGEGNKIRFSNMATTLKACPDVDVDEGAYLEVFELADTYSIHGDILTLYDGDGAAIAVFAAVYF